jgi:hypothetical protein
MGYSDRWPECPSSFPSAAARFSAAGRGSFTDRMKLSHILIFVKTFAKIS